MSNVAALPQTLSADEVSALLARPNVDCPTGLRNRCMIELMLRNGLRAGEVCLLEIGDVRWTDESLRLRVEVVKGGRSTAGTTEGRETAAVAALEPETVVWLQRWKQVRRPLARKTGTKLLFTTLTGGPVHRQYVWAMVRRYARRAGIDHPVWPHMLRHTYGTDLLHESFNIREVQTLMRHSDVRTTMVYTHVHDEQLREKVRRRRQNGEGPA